MALDYVDLHSHFLPALDDGAPDLETSLAMMRAVADLGFRQLVATPHQRAGMFMPAGDAIQAAFADAAREAARALPHVALALGAENFWDDVFHDRLRRGGLPTYPGGHAFLFEVTPSLMPPRIEQMLFEMRVQGHLPVMAHPERYAALQEDPTRAEALGRSAALQVDLAALDGAHGRREMRTARRLVEEGLASALASDLHTPSDRDAVARGMDWVRKRLGPERLAQLLADNPRRILAGVLP